MSLTNTTTGTKTHTTADVQAVMPRLTADFIMIAQSTGAITEQTARDYSHDIKQLAIADYLEKVDVTLMSGKSEIRAAVYETKTDADGLKSSRPGGVLWPRVDNADIRVILSCTESYTDEVRQKMQSKLKIRWTPTSDDTSHSSLSKSGGRDYVSNAYGQQRTDYE